MFLGLEIRSQLPPTTSKPLSINMSLIIMRITTAAWTISTLRPVIVVCVSSRGESCSWGLGINGTVNSVKHFPAVTTEASVRPNVSIKGLTRYAQLSAEIPDVGFKVAHR
jgi:hypothetical protein